MLDDGYHFQNVSMANLISSHTGSDEAFLEPSNWLKQCVDHHERCESTTDISLPRCVLDPESLDSKT